MYNAFYELHREPFHVTPDPDFLFPSPAHKEALAAIIYGIEQRKGFVAITGEVGVGKTTILRSYLDFADRQNLKLIYVYNSNLTFDELITTLLQELDIAERPPSTFQAVTLLHEALIEVYRKNQTVVLIIDEAQNMPVETLESLRMLSNLETVTEKLIQIMLIGQPEFDELLQQHRLRQLRQRIAIHARIGPLKLEDSIAYLEHRLAKVAAGTKPIFTKNALRLIAEASEGIPRNLNIISDNALITGYGYQQRPVNTKIVKEVLADRGFTPAAPPVAQPGRSNRAWMGGAIAAAVVAGLAVGVLATRPDLLRRDDRQTAQVQPPAPAQPVVQAPEATKPAPRAPEAAPVAPKVAETARPAEPTPSTPAAPPAPPRVAANPPPERPQLLDSPPVVPPTPPARGSSAGPRPLERPQAQPATPPAQAVQAPPPPAPRPTETARAAPPPSIATAVPRSTEVSRPAPPREAPAPVARAEPEPSATPAPAPAPAPAVSAPPVVASVPPAPAASRPARSGAVEPAAPVPAPLAAATPTTRRAQGPIPLAPPAARPAPAPAAPVARPTPSIIAAAPPAPAPAAPAPVPITPPSVMLPSASGSGIAAPPAVEIAEVAPAARAVTPPPAPSGQTIKAVRAGDSLWTMAEEVYGFVSPSILRRVQDANPQIRNVNVLAPGQEVVFPSVQETPFDRGATVSDTRGTQGRN
jgi:general secretion pathway protein A